MQPSHDQSTDRRVTVVEAAAILGVTPDAVRSQLRRGTLRRDEAADASGPSRPSPSNSTRTVPSAADLSTDQTTVAYIEGLKSRLELLERELADWKEEARRKDHLLAAALERIPALEESPPEPASQPRETPVKPSDVDASTGGTEGATEREKETSEERRSWLHRFFFGP